MLANNIGLLQENTKIHNKYNEIYIYKIECLSVRADPTGIC
jgi:hypothetical protein